jgi:drug/metabolite transporter (DMT)-like permease
MSLRSWAAFAALCLIWGIPYFFVKLALEGFSPAWVAWGRLALAALVLLPIAIKRGVLRPALAHKSAIAVFACVELVVPFFLIALGERWISSSLAGILIATVPLAVIALSPLFGVKEQMSRRRWLGLTVGFAGVVALLGIDTVSGPLQWAGVACLIVATLGYAGGALIVQRHFGDMDELGAVAASVAVASVILLPLAVFTAPAELPSTLAIASIAVLGVVCTALGLLIYFYLIGTAGAARASVITYINPAVAALLGVLVLDESFGPGSMLGLLLILFGSWLSTARSTARANEQHGGGASAECQ